MVTVCFYLTMLVLDLGLNWRRREGCMKNHQNVRNQNLGHSGSPSDHRWVYYIILYSHKSLVLDVSHFSHVPFMPFPDHNVPLVSMANALRPPPPPLHLILTQRVFVTSYLDLGHYWCQDVTLGQPSLQPRRLPVRHTSVHLLCC